MKKEIKTAEQIVKEYTLSIAENGQSDRNSIYIDGDTLSLAYEIIKIKNHLGIK